MELKFLESKRGVQIYLGCLFLLWLFYVILLWFAPSGDAPNRYGISTARLNFIKLTFAIPYLLVWLSTAFSTYRFKRYANLLGEGQEAEGYKKIAVALIPLLLVSVIPLYLSLFASYRLHSFAIQRGVTILSNYVNIVLYLMVFLQLYSASATLRRSANIPFQKKVSGIVGVLSYLLAVVYTWAIFNNPVRTVSNNPLVKPTYYLPDWLIVMTIIIPYVVIWFLGGLAALNFQSYRTKVRGVVYRKAFAFVDIGIATIILLTISIQFLSQVGTYLSNMPLNALLAIIYLLLLAIVIGHVIIAWGARKLTTIEEV